MLRDPDPGGRLRALEWLEVRADPESLPAAREAINDQDEAVRRTARRLVETLDGLRGPKPHQ
jgi:HEAT repeat protein